MPTPIPAQAVVQMVFEYNYNGQVLLNTFHFFYQLTGGAPDYRVELNDLLDDITGVGNWKDDVRAAMSSDCLIRAIQAQVVSPDRLAKVERTVNQFGTRAGAPAPQNVCAVITKKSDIAQRWGVGSWHQPGLLASDCAQGEVAAALVPLLEDIGENFPSVITIPSTATFKPIIWSPSVPSRTTDITDYAVQDSVRVMRRRTLLVGK